MLTEQCKIGNQLVYICIFQYNIGTAVTVMSQDGTTGDCLQNIYGLIPQRDHGASYPSTVFYELGHVRGNDLCFSVMVMKIGTWYCYWLTYNKPILEDTEFILVQPKTHIKNFLKERFT